MKKCRVLIYSPDGDEVIEDVIKTNIVEGMYVIQIETGEVQRYPISRLIKIREYWDKEKVLEENGLHDILEQEERELGIIDDLVEEEIDDDEDEAADALIKGIKKARVWKKSKISNRILPYQKGRDD